MEIGHARKPEDESAPPKGVHAIFRHKLSGTLGSGYRWDKAAGMAALSYITKPRSRTRVMEEEQKPSHAERIGRVFEYRAQLMAGLDQRYDTGALCFAALYIVAEHIWKLPPDSDREKQIRIAHRQLDEALEATRP